MTEARYGWQSSLPKFISADSRDIERALKAFVRDASASQVDSWQNSVGWLKREYEYCVRDSADAAMYSTVLEYELPRDLRT